MSNEIEIRVTGNNQSAPAIAAARKDTAKLGETVTQTGQAYTKAGRDAEGFAKTAKTAAAVAAGVLSADFIRSAASRAVEGIKSTISAASNLNESVNAVTDVFHKNSATVEAWGKKNAESFGLSLRAFNESATPLGAMLKNAGLSEEQVTDQTIKLTERAADMASVFNVDVTTALEAIQAGLRGEQDPLEKFGVSLSAAKVQARALADSGKQNAAALTAQELATARLNIIYDQTNDTAGDFQNTSTGLANATRKANAAIEDAKANIGAAFLPVLASAATLTGKLAGELSGVPGPALVTVGALGAIGTAFVVVAPKIQAAKEVLDNLNNSQSKFARGAGSVVGALGRTAVVLAAVNVAGGLLSATIGDDVNPQMEALTSGLEEFGKTGKVAGETARIFGDNLSNLDYDLGTLGSGGWAKFGNGAASVIEGLTNTGGAFDQSFQHAKERIKAIDSALASLVSSGNAAGADAAFRRLAVEAQKQGISLDDLKAGLPAYAAAMEVAGRATDKVATASQVAAQSVDELDKSFHDTIDSAFALDTVQDKLADDVQRLADQVKAQKEAHDKGAGSLDRNTQAGRDNAAMVRQLIGDTADLAAENQKAGRPIDSLRKNLEDQLRAMGFSSTQIQIYTSQLNDLIAQLGKLPPTVTTNVVVRTSYSGAAGNLGYVHGNAHGGVGGGSYPYAAAGGLPRQGSTPTMMNEQGAELVHLPWGATVYSAGQSKSMMERGDMLDGRGPGGGASSSGGRIELGSDGTRLGDTLVWLLEETIRGKGGSPSLLGLKV